ncbi:MAG: HAD hydrolase-like protein, partial [Spirochaetales bacterium]|nr:HAD hydrolase-like protein [Spirochaetales bacterium]
TLFVSASGEIGSVEQGGDGRAFELALDACGLHPAPAAGARAAALLREQIHLDHQRARRRGIQFPEVEIREVFRVLLQALAAEGLIAAAGTFEIDPGWCERLALEYECRVNPTWPMPGARELLESLRDRGLELGLVSNAQFYTPWLFPAHLHAQPSELGIDDELCLWSYRLGEAKPSAAPFTLALQRLSARHVEASSVLCVGNDLRNDIAPAARAGCRTALFAGDRRSYRPRSGDPALAGLRPDALLTDLSQLPPLLVP